MKEQEFESNETQELETWKIKRTTKQLLGFIARRESEIGSLDINE
ncbi:MAG: hypothetical protein WCQ49_03335 [Candidatus Saccharibacteria bacterium]